MPNNNVKCCDLKTIILIASRQIKKEKIVDLPKIYIVLLTNFVDVEFWQNFDVECRQKAGKIGDLHFGRTLTPLPPLDGRG